MMHVLLIVLSLLGQILFCDEYKFSGKHFIASYLDCDLEAISDVENLIRAMDNAVLSSGASVLNQIHHVFPPNGLTIVYLLSESHASLHTYPEHKACFVDLFTCGDHCLSEKFDELLRAYLKPNLVNGHLFIRQDNLDEIELKLSR